jgi:RHS repeat-associated protein
MTQEEFGTTTPIYNKLFYNSRGQLSEIREGITPNDTNWERGAIINHYSNSCWGMCGGSQSTTAMTDDNGNLKKQDVYISGGALFTQFYAYDSLNRLQSATEDNPNGPANWKQSYIYDRYGNRTIDQNSANTYGNGIPKPNFDLETGTNRLLGPGDLVLPESSRSMRYDAAGNLWKDTYSGSALTRTYDAENRMTQETQANSYIAGVYSYDGDGRRVKRNVGAVETWQVYGVGGELIAEYAVNTSASSLQKEYGYRNGQLLVTATSPLPGGAPAFSDNPIQVGVTVVKSAHITELRTAINNIRAHLEMSSYSWTTSATTNDYISAAPIAEMRTALDQALGAPAGGYASGLASGQPVKAIHIQELRDRLTAAAGSDVRWLVSDQLGTPRMIFDQSGSLTTTVRHDYLPFGEEAFNGTGGRTTAQGYSASDGVRQHFTGQQRDNETSLDYFNARYYASMQGRFTSPDPLPVSAKAAIPQSWNRYTYVLNNPLDFTDPSGMMWIYHYQDPDHINVGIAWIKGNKISKELRAKGYRALNFGGESSMDIKTNDGSVLRLSATSGKPIQLRGPDQSGGEQGYVNTSMVHEFARQTAPMPKAVGLFAVTSLGGGYTMAAMGGTAAMVLANSAAFSVYAVHEQGRNDGEIVAGTRADEYPAGQINEANFADAAMKYLGPGYKSLSNGRYVSQDGMRQIRFGSHETKGDLHAHFEAYDMPGGRVVENSVVKIVP